MSLHRAKNARGGPGRCNLCRANFKDLKDHLNKQHSTHFFVPSDLEGSSLIACPRCGTPCSAGTGLSRHQSRYCGHTAPRIRRNRMGNSTNTAATPIVLSPSPERPRPPQTIDVVVGLEPLTEEEEAQEVTKMLAEAVDALEGTRSVSESDTRSAEEGIAGGEEQNTKRAPRVAGGAFKPLILSTGGLMSHETADEWKVWRQAMPEGVFL